MAKRRKKSRSGSRTGDPVDPGATELGETREADPLVMPPWPTAQCPDDEAVERQRFESAWEAFRRGDFRRCRREAAALAADARSEEVRLRANALSSRLEVDPLALGVAAGALLLLLIILVLTYS